MKGFAPLISTIIVILVAVVGISLVLLIGLPAIERAKESAIFNDMLQTLTILDSLIKEVVGEGVGSLRTFNLNIPEGILRINPQLNSIEWVMKFKTDVVALGSFFKEGNVWITSGTSVSAYEDDWDNDNITELILENEILKIAFQKVINISNGLVLFFPFEEGFGNITKDWSFNKNDGTLFNDPKWVDGKFGKALSFDGVDDYVEVPDDDSLDNTDKLTIEAWVYPTLLDGNPRAIISKRVSPGDQQSYSVFFYTDNRLYVDIDGYNDRFSSNLIFDTNTWYHIVVVYDGTLPSTERVKLYINGELDRTASETSASIPNYASNLFVGVMNSGYTYFFKGIIDEVRIYNRALSEEEIKRMAKARVYFVDTKELIEGITLKETKTTIKPNLNILLDDFSDTSFGVGETKLSQISPNLAKGEFVAKVNSKNVYYEASYTLQAGADFLILRILNSYYK